MGACLSGALTGHRFLPPDAFSPVPARGARWTLFNCFVMGTIPDDLSGIFAHLREAALTMQQGGGIGYDFSTLRPKGAEVKGVGADASGRFPSWTCGIRCAHIIVRGRAPRAR